jgi:hypothetical protein
MPNAHVISSSWSVKTASTPKKLYKVATARPYVFAMHGGAKNLITWNWDYGNPPLTTNWRSICSPLTVIAVSRSTLLLSFQNQTCSSSLHGQSVSQNTSSETLVEK